MKAVRIYETGKREVLTYEDVPKPVIEPDSVLIKVHAAALNPVDWKIRSSESLPPWIALPAILGWDISGVVEESSSDLFQSGDEVYGMVNFPGRGGAYAEYVVAPASHVAHKPQSIDHIHAAAIPLAALTAYQAFELSNLGAGQRVLIHAAAGGVGHLAVQLAKLRGAYVIGTASDYNHDFLRELGIDEIIDYHKVDFENVVRDVDVVLQTIGGDHGQKSIKTVRDGGIIISIVGGSENEPERGIDIRWMLVEPHAEQLQQLAQWVDSGELKPYVQETFPLKEIANAHAKLEEGHTRGKIVLEI